MDKPEDPTPEQPTMGSFQGREHHYPLRVFYEDTDFTGIVYYANYLRFFARGAVSFVLSGLIIRISGTPKTRSLSPFVK